MDDILRTHLDLHADLLEIARLATAQIKANPVPDDHVLPEGITHAQVQKA
jgi:hypothetical protein